MKCRLFLLLLATISHVDGVFAQAPDWHWGRVLGVASATVLATSEGGCYVAAGAQVIRYNDFGDLLWTTNFSEPVRLFRTTDQEFAGFIMQYQENADAAGTSFTAAPGISFVTGFFASDGSLYDLQNFPALLSLQNPVTIADVHRGPGGDLLLIGHFTDSLQVADTTITGYESSGFLASFSVDGTLQWARPLMGTTGGLPSAMVKQSPTGEITINLGSLYPGSLSDTLFGPDWGASAFARFTSEGELLWSFITDGGSLAGDEVLFDLRPDGGLYYSRQTAGLTTGIMLFGALDADGELEWEIGPFENMTVLNIFTGPEGGALFSGTRYGPLVLGDCTASSNSPRMFMIEMNADGNCDWTKQSPDPAYGFRGFAVEHPSGIYYTIGNTDWSTIVLGPDTLIFPSGGSVHHYVARLGVLPMSANDRLTEHSDLLMLYPNPANDEVFISVPDDLLGQQALLYDVLGRSAGSYTFTDPNERIALTGLSSGSYVLKCGDRSVRFVIE